MSALTKKQIAAYEARGFKRWTKRDMDRLYINTTKLGAEIDYYDTGSVRNAKWQGWTVSNNDGRRLLESKVWIDIATGELNVETDFDNAYRDYISVEQAARDYVDSIEMPTEDDGESGYETEVQRSKREFVESANLFIEQNAKHVEAAKEVVRMYADAQPDETWTDGVAHRGRGAFTDACKWAQKSGVSLAELLAKYQQ